LLRKSTSPRWGEVVRPPAFTQPPGVVLSFVDELFGPEVGAHARSAVGMAELPFGMPVEIEGEVLISD
jgi:enamine deaminase RidA (YjgF/YER057c/UK114 family)